VTKIEAKKIQQGKDLTIEIWHMWNVKTKVIPVIIGATQNHSEFYLSNILGKPEI
jgi:hypothetical protein